MKNKRKYENSAPATADEISKKSLKKLKKLTKPENPLAKVRYNCVQEIESGDWRVERLEREKKQYRKHNLRIMAPWDRFFSQ